MEERRCRVTFFEAAFKDWTPAQYAIVIAAAIAFIGIIVGPSVAYWYTQRAARRERRAAAFAAAIDVVEQYAELPYRVRRRLGTPEARHALTEEISKIQSQLAHNQALLQIECPKVAEKYVALVRAAKIQAGGQMKDAWKEPVLETGDEMNLDVRYPRDQIDQARDECINAMRDALPGKWGKVRLLLPTANSDPAITPSGDGDPAITPPQPSQ
jgi:hypothetical protein